MKHRWYYPLGSSGVWFGYFESHSIAALMSHAFFERRWPQATLESFVWIDDFASFCYFCTPSQLPG